MTAAIAWLGDRGARDCNLQKHSGDNPVTLAWLLYSPQIYSMTQATLQCSRS